MDEAKLKSLLPDGDAQSSTTLSVQTQLSDPVAVVIAVIYVARSHTVFQNALRRLDPFFSEFTRADGMPGAKLICRQENRADIERFLINYGIEIEGRHHRLDEMKPRHLIVQHEFDQQIDELLRSFPIHGPERIAPISHLGTRMIPLPRKETQDGDAQTVSSLIVEIIHVARSHFAFQNALRLLDPFFAELTRADGMPGARLICRPEIREAIEIFLTNHGTQIEGRQYRLDDLRPRHLIVHEEFAQQIDELLKSFPKHGPDRVVPINRYGTLVIPVRKKIINIGLL